MSAFAMVTSHNLSEHQPFTRNFALKLFHIPIAAANNLSSKYYLQFLTDYFYQKVAKIEQNWMMRTKQN